MTDFQIIKRTVNGVEVVDLDIVHTSDDDLVIDYDATPDSGSPSVPSAASLVISQTRSGSAITGGTVAATVTDNTTSYNIRAVLLQAVVATMSGVYYYRVTETHSAAPVNRTPVAGVLTIREV